MEYTERLVRVIGGPAVEREGPELWLKEAFATLPGLEDATFFVQDGSANLSDRGATERVQLAQVAPGFFEVLGVGMSLGRGFGAADAGRPVVVLGQALWRQSFGADPQVLGATLSLNGRAYTIVGVAPADVTLPGDSALWLPLPFTADFYGSAFGGEALGRLAPGAGVEALNSLLAERVAASPGNDARVPPPRLVPLRGYLLRDVRGPMITLAGAALIVLLLGGLNLAGLWGSRAAERIDELRLRRALGASRRRVVGDLVAETVPLALGGAAAAVLVARGAISVFTPWLPAALPGTDTITGDPMLALAAVVLSLATVCGFGLLAAAGGVSLERGATRRSGDGRRSRRLQDALVIGQGALALVLLAGAGLMTRSFQELATAPLGFEPAGAIGFQARLPGDVSDDGARQYARDLESRLATIPGVTAVGLTDQPPLSLELGYAVRVRAPGDEDDGGPYAHAVTASRGYFAAAGIPVLDGSPLAPPGDAEPGLVVDAKLAIELFGDTAAAGRSVEVREFVEGQPVWRTTRVRAVVGRVHAHGIRLEAYPSVYYDLDARPAHSLGAIVRVAGSLDGVAEKLRAAALEVDPTVAPYRLRSLRAQAAAFIETDRALALIGSALAAIAVALAALGLYGLSTRQVVRCRRDHGVRLAIGAKPAQLVNDALRRALAIGLVSAAIGLPGALAAAGLLRSRLFGIEPFDPLALGAGVVGLLTVVLVASWIPAWRIRRIDPREALAGP